MSHLRGLSAESTRFLVRFFVLFGVLQFVLWIIDLSFLEQRLAELVGGFLGVPVIGNTVAVSDGVFEINNACTGFSSVSVLLALIFAWPVPTIKRKIGWAVAGSIVLLLLNIPRLLLVIGVGAQWGVAAAEWVHVITWLLMGVAVIGLWWLAVSKKLRKIV